MTAIDRAEVEAAAAWATEAARYFNNRPTDGEDLAVWANVFNAENATKAAALLLRLVDERDGARGYLGRILVSLHPQCEPLPDLMGVCTQIDNALTEISTLRAQIASARETALMEAAEACHFRAHRSYPYPLKTAALFMHEAFACETAVLALIQKDQPHD